MHFQQYLFKSKSFKQKFIDLPVPQYDDSMRFKVTDIEVFFQFYDTFISYFPSEVPMI